MGKKSKRSTEAARLPRPEKLLSTETGRTGSTRGGAGGATSAALIWRFPLERPTALARGTAEGLPAEGTPERTNGRILVDSDRGSLGLAPAAESRRMLAALGGAGGRLAGRLISVEEGGERRPWAELRLVA
jgi:hypothetical protein